MATGKRADRDRTRDARVEERASVSPQEHQVDAEPAAGRAPLAEGLARQGGLAGQAVGSSLLALQASHGNDYVQRLMRSQAALARNTRERVVLQRLEEYPGTATVDGESVNVASKAEEDEARKIIDDIKAEYGITVKSSSGAAAIRKDYSSAPEDVRKSVDAGTWEIKELRALKAALAHFAPVLGKSRDDLGRKDEDQEVTTVSKVEQAIDTDSAEGVLDTTTLGEYFKSSKNFSMFNAGTDSTVDFTNNLKQLEGTAIHEIAHGLMKHVEGDWLSEFDYWTDASTASGKAGAEAPITTYGETNLGEDMAEAVMYFFVDEATLKDKCPKRHAFIAKEKESWDKKKDEE